MDKKKLSSYELLAAIGNIDEKYIKEANRKPKVIRNVWVSIGTLAAVFLLLLVATPVIRNSYIQDGNITEVTSEGELYNEGASIKESAPNEGVTSNEGTAIKESAPNDMVMAVTPEETDDLKEACDKAGFEFSLSQAEKGYEKVSYLYRENLEIQAVYKDDKDNIGYYVIKANGNSDVSGDYNSYENIEKVTTDGKKVTLKGNKGKWSTATWTKGGFSYAIVGSNKTFSKEKILEIAGKTR